MPTSSKNINLDPRGSSTPRAKSVPDLRPFVYHQEVEVRIARVGVEGLGIGFAQTSDGPQEVRVPFTEAGDLVRVKVWGKEKCNKTDFSPSPSSFFYLADLVEVIEPSASRVTPRCPLFGICCGCQYQHLSYERQQQLKQIHLREIYANEGIAADVLPTIASPREYAYRTKLTPHYQPLKISKYDTLQPLPSGKLVEDPEQGEQSSPVKGLQENRPAEFPIGFLSTQNRRLVDVPACPIATEAINAALPRARAETLLHKETFKRDGTLHLREDASGEVLQNPRALCTQIIRGVKYEFVAGEFFQVNSSILPLLAETVMTALNAPLQLSSSSILVEDPEQGAKRRAEGLQENQKITHLIDAYCGVGFFALQAAKDFQTVAGVEVNAAAIDLARTNAAMNGLANVTFLAAKAEAIFGEVNVPAAQTAVILDPPRAGCSGDFLRQLLALHPARVIYVACDPATQARDVKILRAGGYDLKSLQALDLFPQTKHIESLAVMDLPLVSGRGRGAAP